MAAGAVSAPPSRVGSAPATRVREGTPKGRRPASANTGRLVAVGRQVSWRRNVFTLTEKAQPLDEESPMAVMPAGRMEDWDTADVEAWSSTLSPDMELPAESVDFGAGKGMGLDHTFIVKQIRAHGIDGRKLLKLSLGAELGTATLKQVFPHLALRQVWLKAFRRTLCVNLLLEDARGWSPSRVGIFIKTMAIGAGMPGEFTVPKGVATRFKGVDGKSFFRMLVDAAPKPSGDVKFLELVVPDPDTRRALARGAERILDVQRLSKKTGYFVSLIAPRNKPVPTRPHLPEAAFEPLL